MRDSDIRRALDTFLRATHLGSPTIIRHEVGLCSGKRRIDLVTVNDELNGYEIKSDEDTLGRLLGQAAAYGEILDRATLVTTSHHRDTALSLLPPWWGVMIARQEAGTIRFENYREAILNRNQVAFSLVQLLWREEALEELRLRGKGTGLSHRARHYVWVALANAVSLDELRSIVRSRLKARPDWPGGQLHAQNGVMLRMPAIG